jgi:ribosomal protein L31
VELCGFLILFAAILALLACLCRPPAISTTCDNEQGTRVCKGLWRIHVGDTNKLVVPVIENCNDLSSIETCKHSHGVYKDQSDVTQSEGHVEDDQDWYRDGERRDRGDAAGAAKSGIAGFVRSGC